MFVFCSGCSKQIVSYDSTNPSKTCGKDRIVYKNKQKYLLYQGYKNRNGMEHKYQRMTSLARKVNMFVLSFKWNCHKGPN